MIKSMETIATIIQPFVNLQGQQKTSTLRRNHAKHAMVEVARLIKELLTVIPLSFLSGAVNGPILVLGTFAFTTPLVAADSTLLGTMGQLAFYAGIATVLLTIVPRMNDCIREVSTDLLWLCNPKAMERAELHRRSITIARVITFSALAFPLLAIYNSWDLGIKTRFFTPLT